MASAPKALRGALPALATVVGTAVALQLVYGPWWLNYDARYALLWARDLTTGHAPEFGADFAPTPHPLSIAWSFLGLPFGDASGSLLVFAILLAFGALVWLTYRLGAELFGRWAGVVAALVVLTRPAFDRDAILAYQDIVFEGLIVLAVLLEARRPRRGVPVLGVLALAGLVRPEAWALSGLYFLYLWPRAQPRDRARFLAVAVLAPVLWMLMDLLVTSDPLHSLHGTADLAEEAGRRRKVTQVPRWTAQYLAFTLREPLILGVPIGLWFAWRHRRHEAALPLAVVVAMLAVFAVGPIFGLPLIGRYVRTPSVLLALFYGLAVAGWLLLPEGSRERRRWLAVGVFSALLSVAFLPKQVDMLRGLHKQAGLQSAYYNGLKDLAHDPRARSAFDRCGPLSVADHRPIPFVRDWLRGAPGSVGTVEKHASPLGDLLVVPRTHNRTIRRFYRSNLPHRRPPSRYHRVYANHEWALYASPACPDGTLLGMGASARAWENLRAAWRKGGEDGRRLDQARARRQTPEQRIAEGQDLVRIAEKLRRSSHPRG